MTAGTAHVIGTEQAIFDTRLQYQTGQITVDTAMTYLVHVLDVDPADAWPALHTPTPLAEFRAAWADAQDSRNHLPTCAKECPDCATERDRGPLWHPHGAPRHTP